MVCFAGMLDALILYFEHLSPGWLYFALFLSSYIENIVPPVPGDTVLVFAAYLVGRSQRHLLGVFVSTTVGSAAGFMTYYALGRWVGQDYFLKKNFRFLPAQSIIKAGNWFRRYGYWILLANRFLSGIRSVISIVAGIYMLPWLWVLALALVSCGVWNGVLIWIGYALGQNWKLIEDILRQYNRFLLTTLILAGGFWLVRRKLSGPSSR